MSTQSAHKGILSTIRQKLATWLHEPTETPWQRFRAWGYDAPEPVNNVNALAPAHIPLIDGIAGGAHWPGPSGSWSATQTGRLPHMRRETAIAVQPTSVRLITLAPTPPVDRAALFAVAESECAPNMSDGGAPTVLAAATIARRRQQWTDAMSQLPSGESEDKPA